MGQMETKTSNTLARLKNKMEKLPKSESEHSLKSASHHSSVANLSDDEKGNCSSAVVSDAEELPLDNEVKFEEFVPATVITDFVDNMMETERKRNKRALNLPDNAEVDYN